MKIKSALLAAVIAAGISTVSVAQEQVDNGGFNGGLGDWSFSSPLNQFVSGLANVGVVDTRAPGQGFISQVMTLVAGSYNFSFTGFLNGNSQSSLLVIIADSAGEYLQESFNGSEINGSQTGYTFTVDQDGDYDMFFFGTARGGIASFIAVDNVSVTPVVPVPGPEAGAGLAGLAMAGMYVWALRRRKAQATA